MSYPPSLFPLILLVVGCWEGEASACNEGPQRQSGCPDMELPHTYQVSFEVALFPGTLGLPSFSVLHHTGSDEKLDGVPVNEASNRLHLRKFQQY